MKPDLKIIINLIVFLAFLPTTGFTQYLNGIVCDSIANPVPFASIGILNGHFGTVAKENGTFRLDLKKMKFNDTLRVSCLGFQLKDFLVQQIINLTYFKIILDPLAYPIDEIQIKPGNKNPIEFGEKNKHNDGFGFGSMGEGWELARLFTNSDYLKLKECHFFIKYSDYDSLLFRLNIYSKINEMPGQLINNSPIYIKTTSKKGWIICPLSYYNITIDNDFFISIEAIQGWGPNDISTPKTMIILSGKNKKDETTYQRLYSQGGWRKVDSLMLDFYLISD